MTDRQRILAVLNGTPPDRMPWIPRLSCWYNAHIRLGTMPQRYAGMTLRQIDPFWQRVVTGAILLAAVMFDRLKQSRRN